MDSPGFTGGIIKAKKMKVKFLKSHALFAYFVGDEAEMSEEQATTLINGGFVKSVDDSLPKDIPARKLLIESGLSTKEALKDITVDALTQIKGIGPKAAQEIVEMVKSWEALKA